jgi:hypothetical protein
MLVDELGELLDGFQGSLWRVRCFAHILNLVVKVRINVNFKSISSESLIIAPVYPIAIQQQDNSRNRCDRGG